jgi:hypothetical protein
MAGIESTPPKSNNWTPLSPCQLSQGGGSVTARSEGEAKANMSDVLNVASSMVNVAVIVYEAEVDAIEVNDEANSVLTETTMFNPEKATTAQTNTT